MIDSQNHRTIARLSIEYVASFLCEGVAESELDILDFSIMLVVSAGNSGRLKSTPASAAHAHGEQQAVPPQLMNPTSLLTIEESLKLSPANARERVAALVARGILVEVGEGAFIIGQPVTSSNTAARLAGKNAAMARRLVKQLSDVGLAA